MSFYTDQVSATFHHARRQTRRSSSDNIPVTLLMGINMLTANMQIIQKFEAMFIKNINSTLKSAKATHGSYVITSKTETFQYKQHLSKIVITVLMEYWLSKYSQSAKGPRNY